MARFFSHWLLLGCAAFVSAIAMLVSGCSRRNTATGSERAKDSKTITVGIDPRVEVIGVMRALIRERKTLEKLDFEYARLAHEWFEPHARHPALTRFAAADRKLGGGDVPVWAALHFTAPPEMRPDAPLPAMLSEISKDPAPFNDLIDAMREFSSAASFSGFRTEAATTHAAVVAPVQAALARARIIAPFEAYLGEGLPEYRVVLAPLLHDANYGLRVVKPGSLAESCVVVVRRSVRGGQAQFGGSNDLRRLLWHEFGHSIVNPAMEAHMERITALPPTVFPPGAKLPPSMNPSFLAYARVNEYVIRAMVVRLLTLEAGEKAGQLELEQQMKIGYTRLPGLCEALKAYEANRAKYPTFKDFLPLCLDALGRDS